MTRTALSAFVIAASMSCSSGQNTECRWPDEPSRPLDLRLDLDAGHLMNDVELAEELSVRFADALPQGPGPLKQRLRMERCFDPLVAGIMLRHGVTRGQVLAAQARLGERGWNPVVNIPVLAFFGVATFAVLRRIRRRFAGEPVPIAVASLLAAVAIAGLTTGFGRVWQMLWESIRIGNGHLGGTRGLRLPWVQYSFEYFLVALVGFMLIAAAFHTRALRRRV